MTTKTTTASAKSPVSSRTAKKVRRPSTTFALYAPDAHEVFLIGEFNDWQTHSLKAKKGKDGRWTKSLELRPGSYQYLFLVDGEWWTDPVNPHRAPNPFGTENSVIVVT